MLISTRCPTTSSRCSGTLQTNESLWLRSRLDQSDPVVYRITSLHWLSDEVLQQELGRDMKATDSPQWLSREVHLLPTSLG
jgi:hypothetical protein